MQVEVIDYQYCGGVKISRDENRKDGISLANSFFMDIPNFSLYIPKNPMSLVSTMFSGDKTKPMMLPNLTVEVIVRFRTNMKLSLQGIDQETKDTIYLGSQRDEEYHFVKFEGCLPPVEMSESAFRKLSENFQIQDWTITDFDNYLQGNPHI